jgi:hypothetical protein
MTDPVLDAIRDLIQEDVGNRGLRTDPEANLITACPNDFREACHSIADAPGPVVAIVTGFFIPHAQPPCGETDGPLGAIFLARALSPLGIRVALVTDSFCKKALEVGLSTCGLQNEVLLVTLPPPTHPWNVFIKRDWQDFMEHGGLQKLGRFTHLIALERVGPSHTPASIRNQFGSTAAPVERFSREVPGEHHNRCHTMNGRDITAEMAPAHLLFEAAKGSMPPITTIGIGDGGNEIGMGKLDWEIVRHNIPNGGTVACRVATDYLIVSGVSNWGAYGLAGGVRHLLRAPPDKNLFDPDVEREVLREMVENGPLVDGVTGKARVTVDGLPFERYVELLRQMATMLKL